MGSGETASFNGFPQTGLDLLAAIGEGNRDFFQDNKKQYDAEIASPAKAFVDAMTDRLQGYISPLIEGQAKTNGSISPINNDLRFNPDASPYKDHLLIKWWEGPNKKTAPTLWIRMSGDDVGFASGIAISDIDRWRTAVGESTGESLAAAIDALAGSLRAEGLELDVAGQGLKKVPKPWPEDHPRGDLLRHKMFQVRWPGPAPETITSAAFVDHCTEQLGRTADVHRWLAENLG